MLTKSKQLSWGVVRSVYLLSLQNFPFNQQEALHMKITSLTCSTYKELLQKRSNWDTKRFIFPRLSKNVAATVRPRATGHHVNNGLSYFGWDGRDSASQRLHISAGRTTFHMPSSWMQICSVENTEEGTSGSLSLPQGISNYTHQPTWHTE